MVNGMMLFFVNMQTVLQSITYSVIVDVEPANFETEQALNLERQYRAKLMMIPVFVIMALAFSAIYNVKEELKRHRYNLTQSSIAGAKVEQLDEAAHEINPTANNDDFFKADN